MPLLFAPKLIIIPLCKHIIVLFLVPAFVIYLKQNVFEIYFLSKFAPITKNPYLWQIKTLWRIKTHGNGKD